MKKFRLNGHFTRLLPQSPASWYFSIVSTLGVDSGILGDPGADSGDEKKSKRAEKYMERRKVKKGKKSPWGQCLTRPVPNGRCRSGF